MPMVPRGNINGDKTVFARLHAHVFIEMIDVVTLLKIF